MARVVPLDACLISFDATQHVWLAVRVLVRGRCMIGCGWQALCRGRLYNTRRDANALHAARRA